MPSIGVLAKSDFLSGRARRNCRESPPDLLTKRLKAGKSPIGKDDKPIRRCLDAGTGTGVWAIDFGRYLVH